MLHANTNEMNQKMYPMNKSVISGILLVLFIQIFSFAQAPDYPKDFFRSPLDIPLKLSGTFGELRPEHFHSGIDIKTQQKEGLPVYAVADGYVSRIKVSHWGYGKALYITHPNGYTSVYGHLSTYNDELEDYIREQQYAKKSFSVQLFPPAKAFPVKKGQIIAYTGSTGGYVGPHLHFEIRKTDLSKPLNPLLFGFDVPDTKKPVVTSLYAYPLTPDSHVNRMKESIKIPVRKGVNTDYIADEVVAYGTIGFGVGAYDLLNGAANHNGIYGMEMHVDGELYFKSHMDGFSFEHTRDINLHVDYAKHINLRQWVQKCYVEPHNHLCIYDRSLPQLGYIQLTDEGKHLVLIKVYDAYGNTTELKIPLRIKEMPVVEEKKVEVTDYPVTAAEFNKFKIGMVTVAFPKNTFYDDLYLDLKMLQDNVVQVHHPDVPLAKKFTLTFDTSSYSEEDRKHLYIARYNRKKHPVYVRSVRKESKVYTTVRKLGKYALLSDYKPPKVKPHNFYDGKWVTQLKTLQFEISDELSGIGDYTGSIDGQWIRMEWDLKKGLLVYRLDDLKLCGAKHEIKVSVSDHAGNTKSITLTFYRKFEE